MNPKKWTGVGDVVETVATVTGAKAVAKAYEKVTGNDCGCGKRKEALNKAFPFKDSEPKKD